MLSNKERSIWVFVVIIAIGITYYLVRPSTKVHVTFSVAPTASAQPISDIEKEADQWFTSSPSPISKSPPIPSRDKYTQSTNIEAPLQIYQEEIKRNSSWINYPEQIALRVFYPPPEVEGFVPNKVSIYYYNPYIVTVTVAVSGPYGASEKRFDFVNVGDTWKIVWVGQRSIDIGP